MNWYYKVLGGHTHVRVFMNGGKCGELVFRNAEFDAIRMALDGKSITVSKHGPFTLEHDLITFFNEDGQ